MGLKRQKAEIIEGKSSAEAIDAEAVVIDDAIARRRLKAGYENAGKILRDKDKLEETLLKLEEKLKELPVFGNALSDVPVLIMLVRDYANEEYDCIPVGSIVAVVSALAYVLLGTDLIPDFIPVAGVLDDAAVVAACMKLVESDVNEYRAWKAACKK